MTDIPTIRDYLSASDEIQTDLDTIKATLEEAPEDTARTVRINCAAAARALGAIKEKLDKLAELTDHWESVEAELEAATDGVQLYEDAFSNYIERPDAYSWNELCITFGEYNVPASHK